MMKSLLFILTLLIAAPLHAITFSHRTLAENLVREISGPAVLKQSVHQALEPFLRQLRRDDMPEDLIAEVRQAFLDWLEEDIKWDEISPALAAAYAEQFDEKELTQILAFVQSPAGSKFLNKHPELIKAGIKLREDYAKTKQPELMARIQPLLSGYQSRKAAQSDSSR